MAVSPPPDPSGIPLQRLSGRRYPGATRRAVSARALQVLLVSSGGHAYAYAYVRWVSGIRDRVSTCPCVHPLFAVPSTVLAAPADRPSATNHPHGMTTTATLAAGTMTTTPTPTLPTVRPTTTTSSTAGMTTTLTRRLPTGTPTATTLTTRAGTGAAGSVVAALTDRPATSGTTAVGPLPLPRRRHRTPSASQTAIVVVAARLVGPLVVDVLARVPALTVASLWARAAALVQEQAQVGQRVAVSAAA